MRHVELEAGIHHQLDGHAVLGDGRQIAHRGEARLGMLAQCALGFEGGDDFGLGAQVRLAGFAVDHDAVADARGVGDAFRRADQRQAHRARDDRDMRGRGGVFQHQADQPLAAIVEQFGRTHRARDDDGVERQFLRRRRRR